jgi:hypothetical protein
MATRCQYAYSGAYEEMQRPLMLAQLTHGIHYNLTEQLPNLSLTRTI